MTTRIKRRIETKRTAWKILRGLPLLCLVAALTSAAFAVSPKEVLNVTRNQVFTGACCFSWGESVSVTEPAKISAVVVTFETDFELTPIDQFNVEPFTLGLMINGGPCRTDLGPHSLHENHEDSAAFLVGSLEWIVLPDDGLVKGTNTFTLCGGGPQGSSKITLGFNTLAVRISK